MTDREMLEWAAKAAGLLPLPVGKELDCTAEGGLMFCGGGTRAEWNPLHDDGDALRLAVRLNLWAAVRDGHQHLDSDNDHYAATRRAIVRVAAEIGRNMEAAQ